MESPRSAQIAARSWMAPFFTIWTGQAFSLLGSQLVQFALVWWLTRKTGSATVLAMATLVALLPQVFLGPIAGALVDRWSRRVTMIVADSLIALATIIIAILFLTGTVQIWHIYLLMFVRSAAGGFHWPAMQASTSLMVPNEHLARVQGANQMLQGGMNIFSAPLGALLLELLPIQGILMIDVVTALMAITPLFFIPVPQPPRSASELPGGQTDSPKTSVWQDFAAGLHYAFSWPGLIIIGLMATLINLLMTPAFSLLPILVFRYFNGQAFQLAWFESGWGIGVVLGGLALGIWGGFRRKVYTSLFGLIGMGISLIVVGLVPSTLIGVAVAAIFISGFFNPIVNGPLLAAVQAVVAPEMQGRVFTLILSVAGAMSPLGLLIAGPVADRLGVTIWFIVGGVVTLLMGAGAFFIRAVIHFEDRPAPAVSKELSGLAVSSNIGD